MEITGSVLPLWFKCPVQIVGAKITTKERLAQSEGYYQYYGNSHPEEVFYFRAEEFIVSQFEDPSNCTDFESIKFNVRNKPTMLALANPPRANQITGIGRKRESEVHYQ